MAENDHPELDTTDELGPEDIKRYQSLIGALQWLITLGRFRHKCRCCHYGELPCCTM